MSDDDWELALTRDPMAFFEAVVINIVFSEGGTRQDVVDRQKAVFKRWLAYYNQSYRTTIAASEQTRYKQRMNKLIAEAERKGYLYALSNLPLKKSFGREIVDLGTVATMITKAKEE